MRNQKKDEKETTRTLRACLGVQEGERRALEKRMEEVEGIEDLGGSFFFIIQNPPIWGN